MGIAYMSTILIYLLIIDIVMTSATAYGFHRYARQSRWYQEFYIRNAMMTVIPYLSTLGMALYIASNYNALTRPSLSFSYKSIGIILIIMMTGILTYVSILAYRSIHPRLITAKTRYKRELWSNTKVTVLPMLGLLLCHLRSFTSIPMIHGVAYLLIAMELLAVLLEWISSSKYLELAKGSN